MAKDKRARHKGRKTSGGFMQIPYVVYDCPNFHGLSAHARRALLDVLRKYNGYNNGDLSLTWTTAHRLGWRSRETLEKALAELVHFGMIIRTRQGGLNRANLYAFTWREIDDCKGKLDVGATRTATGQWRVPVTPFISTKKRGANTAVV
jgi:hypothetical protein